MKRISRARFLSSAAPLLTIAARGRLGAQSGDTPIIITDGSLKMNSAVRWGDYVEETARRRRHPSTGRRVSRVDVQLSGGSTSVQFTGQECEVRVTYDGMEVAVTTNPAGRNLKMETDWNAFKSGATENDLEHANAGSHISRVVVRRNGAIVAEATPSGGTRVTIHYEE
ncbi:MAG: hypothetical protein C0504_03115 [Candidatus Solibacter sp.]|nr:hypothetical protein [Candidatus Solibacter sp.]